MSSFLRSLGLSMALLASFLVGEAAAQGAACQRYRAELASLDRSGGRSQQMAAAAQRQRAEIARLMGYSRSIGCDRGPFILFGGPPPAECGSIAQRLRAMEANYASLLAQSDGGVEARRRALLAAVEQACDPRGNFFERLFNGGPALRPDDGLEAPLPDDEPRARGGSQVVCVRTCDGSFFPLANNPGGRGGAEEMCQALCPNAPMAVYRKSPDGDIEQALSIKGEPYSALPAALKFRKGFDASCSCRAPGQSWAEALARAEEMIERRRGDILVSAQKAEELSRAKPPAPPREARGGRLSAPAKLPASDEAEAAALEASGAAAPTASHESAGIGPSSIETERPLPRGEGQTRSVTTSEGARRTVRVVPPTAGPIRPDTALQ
ncbi:MAG TPA: DUF2865 domain-containing protein [Beijerinckiaceae bacterium]